MSALQPEMKALEAKYKDDPLKMQKKMGEFWKEHKVNPDGRLSADAFTDARCSSDSFS